MVKLSILIPAYNAAEYILDNLNSLLNQTYKYWEAIIVNDGSSDNTLELINTFQYSHPECDVKVISIPNGGLANARNVAMEACTGDYFCNLDSDDFLDHGTLKLVADTLEKNPDVDIVYYDIYNYNHQTKVKSKSSKIYHNPNNTFSGIDGAIMKLKRDIWICQGVAFYKQEFVNRIGLRNIPGINQGEDLFFITVAFAYSDKVKYVPEAKAYIRYRDDSMMHAPFNVSLFQSLVALDNLKIWIDRLEVDETRRLQLYTYIARERIIQELRIFKSISDEWGERMSFFQTVRLLKRYKGVQSKMVSSVKANLSKHHLLQYYLARYSSNLFVLLTKIYRKAK